MREAAKPRPQVSSKARRQSGTKIIRVALPVIVMPYTRADLEFVRRSEMKQQIRPGPQHVGILPVIGRNRVQLRDSNLPKIILEVPMQPLRYQAGGQHCRELQQTLVIVGVVQILDILQRRRQPQSQSGTLLAKPESRP